MTDLATNSEGATLKGGPQNNENALASIRRELTSKPFDKNEFDKYLQDKIRRRKRDDPKIDEQEELREAKFWASSAEWSDLNKLALMRCAVWIAHADGYGLQVGDKEEEFLSSHDPRKVAHAARHIIKRLSEIVVAPVDEGGIIARSRALHGIIKAGTEE